MWEGSWAIAHHVQDLDEASYILRVQIAIPGRNRMMIKTRKVRFLYLQKPVEIYNK